MNLADSPIVQAYRRHTPKSAELARRAAGLFPGGVTHDGRLLDPYPIFIERAAGSRKWDVDGHEYVDYTGGHGALLLGHSHPSMVEAVRRQAERGTHYGACHELEVRWAELVQGLIPSAERVRFTSSGTEATMMAMRLARAFTGKTRILRFAGHFHGWHDHVAFGVASHFDGTPTPGVLAEVAGNVALAPPGDVESTLAMLQRYPDIAAAIIEPTGASWGQVPLCREFLVALREATAARGVLLIFDEVVSGFRCSPGGAQAALGIRPDLTTLAKILAGGLPGGAVAGRKDILDRLDPAVCAAAGSEKIPHQGTFNANPLSAAAGIATLELVATTDVCRRANDYAARLRAGLNQVLSRQRVPWVVYGTYSGFHIFVNPDGQRLSADDIEQGPCDYRVLKAPATRDLSAQLRLAMILHGVEIFSWPGGPTSAVHDDADLDRTIDAFTRSLRMLRDQNSI